MKLTDAQVLKLREAVEHGQTCEYHPTQRRTLKRLVVLGMLRRNPDPPWGKVLFPLHYPTARGRAYMRWWSCKYDKPIKPFRCLPGGQILPFHRL
jgi:hypothetical protein